VKRKLLIKIAVFRSFYKRSVASVFDAESGYLLESWIMRLRTVGRDYHSCDSSAPLILGVLITSLSLLLSGSLAALSYPHDSEDLSELQRGKVILYGAHLLADIVATKPQMSAQTQIRPKQLSIHFSGPPLERVGHPFTTLGHFSAIDQDVGSFLLISLPLSRAPPRLR
jgi:hypothetical protein